VVVVGAVEVDGVPVCSSRFAAATFRVAKKFAKPSWARQRANPFIA